jgi:hypothetical protein
MIRGEVAVALDHGQALPAPQLLNRAQVYPSHDEPGGESMPVAVPRVSLKGDWPRWRSSSTRSRWVDVIALSQCSPRTDTSQVTSVRIVL